MIGIRRVRRWLRRLGVVAVLFLGLGGFMVVTAWSAFGAAPTGTRLERVLASPQFRDGGFDNPLPATQASIGEILLRWLAPRDHGEPTRPIRVTKRKKSDFSAAPASGLRITWLGHSSMLVEIDGHRVLTDPVFSDRSSPWSFYGPKRFHVVPVTLEELPPLHAVVLSHDHYDHLDEQTIHALTDRVPVFVAPLGLGAHLEYWGVPREKIVELDWWEDTTLEKLKLVATPARHFSGRSLWDRNRTLWASWAIVGPEHRVFFSGDTAMSPQFSEIGQRFGPFDATMMEVGAYSRDWPDVHLGPEQAVDAHRMVKGQVLFPIHWGTFNLAYHAWTEPIERLRAAAALHDVQLVAPRPGQSIEPGTPPAVKPWWPRVPWQTAKQSPVVSTGLGRATGGSG